MLEIFLNYQRILDPEAPKHLKEGGVKKGGFYEGGREKCTL